MTHLSTLQTSARYSETHFWQICSVAFSLLQLLRVTVKHFFADSQRLNFPLATSVCYSETHSWQILHHPVHQSLEL